MDDLAALRLQIEWGADEALEEAPLDRLRPVDAPPPAMRARVAEEVPPARSSTQSPTGTPAERALQSAAAATSLPELRDAIAAFDGCALRDTATHLVFAEGDPASGLLLIGEPPGAPEDRSGTPFAGPTGGYLDRMLVSIGLDRSRLLLTHLIPWRPPGDRPPSAGELAICLPFLHRLIVLSGVGRLVIMGPLAARMLLPPPLPRRRVRGAWIDIPVTGAPAALPGLPTFSSAELMRSPKDRRAAWADLRLLRRTLDADAASA